MNEVTKPSHTPTVAAVEGMNVGIRKALTTSYFQQLFENEPTKALQSYALFGNLPRAMPAYEALTLQDAAHAKIALKAIARHENLPRSVPLMLAINDTYPTMLAKFTSVRAITSPEVIAAMVKSSGKVDIATGSDQVDRVQAALANIMEEPQHRVGEVQNKGALAAKGNARAAGE